MMDRFRPSATSARATLVAALLFGCSMQSLGQDFTLATWNMNNLHEQTGYAWREGAPSRSDTDYLLLQRYAEELAADIVALQEVNSPLAARRVFPESDYDIFFSGRRQQPAGQARPADGIYLAFAVRRGRFDMVRARDIPAIGAVYSHPLRWGLELIVDLHGQQLSVLNVHLKSGCFGASLESPPNKACEILSRQRIPLEAWIDERAAGGMPFVVAGDFNRAFDVHGEGDHLWQDIDDGKPPGLALYRLPYKHANQCWKQSRRYHRNPIDFMVFDALAWGWVDRQSFRQLDFQAQHRDPVRALPSDHCPISVRLSPQLRRDRVSPK